MQPEEKITRRRGVYYNTMEVLETEQFESSAKRRLQRRYGTVMKNIPMQSIELEDEVTNSESNSGVSTKPVSQSIDRLDNGNMGSMTNENPKRVYLIPSSSDIVEVCSSKEHGGIGIEEYAKVMFSDQYREANSITEQLLIVHTFLHSIKERGGKFLKESSKKQGMYFEVDENYSIKHIRKTLNKLKNA